ncbi:hypothetical protein OEZ86_000377 [Tetradesmus obliquus]|nr:hypothetical protein OEZ86_000376 [Tetradesmus obliquus]WIA30288.1 hypothetical protein OEZ86_000377 [Tetradesmus obliquus]
MSVIRRFLLKLGLLKVKANVLVLGLAHSGKTTLVNCLMEAGDQEVVPTVGFSMEKVHFDRCKLTVIDMSGQEKYQPLWEMHYTDAKALVFIVDAANPASMRQAAAALEAVVAHQETQGLPLLVFANKMDLPDALQPAELAEQMQLPQVAQRAFHITSCSALRNEGVQEGMKWLAGQLQLG